MREGPWSSRQGRKSGKVKVLSPSIACIRRIAYPVRAEATKHVLPGSTSLGRPAKSAAVGAIWETSKLGGLNARMSDDNLETSPRKIVFAEEAGSRLDLQGGPRKCDFVFMTRCTRLGSIPTEPACRSKTQTTFRCCTSQECGGERRRKRAQERDRGQVTSRSRERNESEPLPCRKELRRCRNHGS